MVMVMNRPQGCMVLDVRLGRHDLQVLRTIIFAVMVQVMDMFIRPQRTPKNIPLNDPAMLAALPAINLHPYVPVFVSPTPTFPARMLCTHAGSSPT
jgi:hypothetical protein